MNLSKYFVTDTSKISIPCAPIGQYDILLRTRSNAKRVKLFYSLTHPNRQAFSHYVHSSRIRYENRLQKRQVLLQWDKRYVHFDRLCLFVTHSAYKTSFFFSFGSKLDIHAMKYCIAINAEKSKNTLCDALDSIIGADEPGRIFCSQLKISDHVIRIGMKCLGRFC